MRTLLFLVDISVHLQDSARHIYVEVVLHGKTEGQFLEDTGVRHEETMGQISKLGGFLWRTVGQGADCFPCRISSLLVPRRHKS